MNTQDTNFAQIARDFVTLALKEGTWKDNKDKQLSDTDRATVLKTVAAAGFKPGAIIFGPLSTGSDISSYIVNTTCPYRVAGEGCEDDRDATAWLEGLVRKLTDSEWVQATGSKKIVEFIQAEIEKAVPLEPIQLTPEGDFLIDVGAPDNRTRDDYGLRVGYVGAHMYCHGNFDLRKTTATLDVIACPKCFIRITFPKTVITYGDLRRYLASTFSTPTPTPA